MVTLRVSEAFVDPAIPDGAHSISDRFKDPDAAGGGVETVAKTSYYVVCEDHPSGQWIGPTRSTREDADADLAGHLVDYPNHNPIVVS
ncbi:hypothetical protein [Glacieibacterium sp.]|uniref:hypothetical protein n=1 Tax=Glacieibacterium sp. TaxID=2860237 RepID=UPI003AFF6548